MQHKSPYRAITAALLLWPLAFGSAGIVKGEPGAVPVARDLHRDAALARASNLVLLVIVSRTDCGYCQVLKREFIRPMLISGDYTDKVLIRELLLDKDTSITDFDGTRTTASMIAQRYDEWLTPTVLFLSPSGDELTPRRRGINTVEYYGYYLDKAIDQARSALPTID